MDAIEWVAKSSGVETVIVLAEGAAVPGGQAAACMYGRLVWVGALEASFELLAAVRADHHHRYCRFATGGFNPRSVCRSSSVSIGKGGIGCKIVFWPQFHSWRSDDSSGLWHTARIH